MKYFFGVNSVIGAIIGGFNSFWFGRRIYFKNNSESDLIALGEGGALLIISSAALIYLVCTHRGGTQQNLSENLLVEPLESKYNPNTIQQPHTLDNLLNLTINTSARIACSTSFLINSIETEQKNVSLLTEQKEIITSFITFLKTWKNKLLKNEQNKDEKIISNLKKLFETIAIKINDSHEDDSISDFLRNRIKDFEKNGLQFLVNTLENQVILKLQEKIPGVHLQLENSVC